MLGMMGSGKSTEGKRLARRLNYDFIDLDILISEKEGQSIQEIFNSKGEHYFRNLESELLKSGLPKGNLVVATGGGTAALATNMDWMKANGVTIYLEYSAGALASRLVNARTVRPLIQGLSQDQIAEKLEGLLQVRQSQYKRAHIILRPMDYSGNLIDLLERNLEQINSF